MVSTAFFLVPTLALAAAFFLATALETADRRRPVRIGLALLVAAALLAGGTVLVARHHKDPVVQPATTPVAPST